MTYYQIYKITNLVNQKVYIGYTQRSLSVRLYQHCLSARKNSSSSLHKAIRKYGEKNFHIELLQQYSSFEAMIQGEKFYIKFYDSYKSDRGYNDTQGGDGGNTNGGKKFPRQWKINISKSRSNTSAKSRRKFSEAIEKEICRLYSVENKSAYCLAKQYNCAKTTISDILLRNKIKIRKTYHKSQHLFSKRQEMKICNLYQTGQYSRMDLAKKFSCSKNTIRDILLRHGIHNN